jgi:hypothetical protein
MTELRRSASRKNSVGSIRLGLLSMLLFVVASSRMLAEASTAAISAFNSYVSRVESRLDRQHRAQSGFLAPVALGAQGETRLRRGELIVERQTPSTGADFPGALLHHWRGTAFAPGAKAADFERLMKDFNNYPRYFSPQVTEAKILAQQGDRLQARMRVRQQHVITVVMDMTYDIVFDRLDRQHGYSISKSTQISEIDSPGSRRERVLNSTEEHGFLWRSNTYWSYEERDGGLMMQVESISLTRAIPRGLDWAVRPFVESVPRESLEFTLRSACNALRK